MSDKLFTKTRFGISTKNKSFGLYGFGHFSYKKYFYGYLYSRIVSDSELYDRYTGVARPTKRAGFNSGETDLAGIGYQNNWLLFQFGRGRQSWGAGNNIQLALSEDSPAYDYGMIHLDFGKIRVRYFHGFLENRELIINRYITGRGIEWSNLKDMVFSLSETVIYSGENRPIDISYINPISTHLEIEFNNRQNRSGSSSGNGVWQVSLDWLIKNNIRFSGNILFDEFVLDKVQKDENKEHGIAYSCRISYSPVINESSVITTFFSFIKVGTPTFRHSDGNNNFIQRGKNYREFV